MQRSERRTPSWLGGYAERRSISMMGHQNAKFVEFWQKMTLLTAATRKILYTPTGAWHGKYFGMAWPYFFSRHAKKQGNLGQTSVF
jgi:hypothetical protein